MHTHYRQPMGALTSAQQKTNRKQKNNTQCQWHTEQRTHTALKMKAMSWQALHGKALCHGAASAQPPAMQLQLCGMIAFIDSRVPGKDLDIKHRLNAQFIVIGTQRLESTTAKTVWPSGLRRWLQAPVRKGVGSNSTAVNEDCA